MQVRFQIASALRSSTPDATQPAFQYWAGCMGVTENQLLLFLFLRLLPLTLELAVSLMNLYFLCCYLLFYWFR